MKTELKTADYEAVIGLEVHVELATVTKLFSASPNRFGDEPNTNIDPVTLGLPGSLPVVNERAVELAIRFGCAIGGDIRPSVFSYSHWCAVRPIRSIVEIMAAP